MDCKSISTFRSLEQQAIRQHRERMIREATYKGMSNSPETTVPENNVDNKLEFGTNNGCKLNLFA